MFLVAAIDHTSGAVLAQRQVPDKRGEGVAARALLTGLHAPGMVWTLDALHTTKATARLITQDLHGHYILIIKGNQPIARDAATALLRGPDTDWVTAATEDDRGHGRVERRTIRVAPADDTLFPGAARPDAPTSPTPVATCSTTTTPSPPSASETVKQSRTGHLTTTPGP